MRLGVNIFNSIVEFFQNVGETLTLEYMLYGFIALEVLLIIVFSVIIHNVYELKLIRAIDKINGYLYNNQYIDETNLIEFNNRMKKVPKTLRYHWQQYMLYREHSPSYYMSIENCIDRPIKSSAFGTNIKVVKILGYILSMISLILSCGALALSGSTGAGFYVAALTTPVLILVINSIFVLALQIKKSTNLSDLYQTFHIFDRFIDKAVATLPEYVDYEVLFTRAEIKKGIPVLNEYIEKRQLQEQEEMKRARLNAVEHEQYNFEAAGDKGTLVLERAMKETETFINLKHRLMTEIEQLEGEMESIKRTYDNKTKDYQKNTQTARENIDRLREQMEATTNRIESNYIRKQQTDEVKKLEQLDRDQDDATLRYNQEINSLTEEVNKRKEELEEGRKYVESAMLAEYKTFANKVFKDVRADVDKRVKDERDELVNSREMVISELENSLSEVEKLEKENSELKNKLGIKDAEYKDELSKREQEIKSKEKFYSQVLKETAEKAQLALGEKINKEPEYDEYGGYYDEEGYYRYKNGTYYDPEGNYHDEFGGIIDVNGVYHAPESKEAQAEEIKEEAKEEPAEIQEELPQEAEELPAETEEAEEEPAKKRGRPRKETVEEENKPAGKRGRPKKVVENEEPKPAGKRGRPRKETTEEAEPKPAGKRGRPRKEPVEEENKQAGKRGRPRKETTGEETPKPAGKRGRPKKNNIDEELKKVEEKLKQQNDLLKQQQQALNETINNADNDENN